MLKEEIRELIITYGLWEVTVATISNLLMETETIKKLI